MSKATSAKKHNLCTVSKSPIWLWYLSYLTEDSGVCKVETTPVTRLRLSDLWKYLFIYLLVYMCVHVGVCVYVFVRVCEVFREHLAGDSLPMGPQSWWQVTLTAEPFCSLVLLKNYFSWFYPLTLHRISQVMWKLKSQHPLIQNNFHLCWKLIRDSGDALTFTNFALRCPIRSRASKQCSDWNEIKRVT